MTHQLILNEPLAQGLNLIGDRWTLLILREAFYGRTRFEEFKKHTTISRATLTRRLNTLIENDILARHLVKNLHKRYEYRLTPKGLSLLGSSLLAVQWESQWRSNSSKQQRIATSMFHTRCEQHLSAKTVCKNCKEAITLDSVDWLDMQEKFDVQLEAIRACSSKNRRARPSLESEQDAGLISLIGDRWTMLILIASFFNTRKYDAFLKQLNIPSSILADRLKYLCDVNVLTKNTYQNKPPRQEYKLSEKGKSLFPFVMSLRQWVSEQMTEHESSSRLIHKNCQTPLKLEVVCAACGEEAQPQDIHFA